MESEKWKILDEILGQTLELPLEDQRAFLERACHQDPSLLAEALDLLAADHQASRFLSEGPQERASRTRRVGETIGSYRLLEEIGRGGMGTVYRAERADGAYEKEVALKLMRPGAVFEDWRRRFRTERQILSRLEHPYIATLLDGGNSARDEPYLVMELVEGRPLHLFCREEKLSLKARIQLLEKVCRAVAFAHQNLVVHRDLKPGNVLVNRQGEPRLLDFGIAKLLEPEWLDGPSKATQSHLRPMSPAYASPEQIRGGPITTATDVWSLGALGYEILTGKCPYGRVTSLVELEAIRSVLPTAPSRKVKGTREQRALRGDLDTIVLKALRSEPERRYGTAAELAEDLRRFLKGLPVRARPSSWGYRLGKFMKRNRLPVGIGAASLTALGGLGVRLALQSKSLREERDKARQTLDLMVKMLGEASARQSPDQEVTVREAMENWEPVMREKLKDQPDLLGVILGTTGKIYTEMCLYDEARPRLQEAIRLLEANNPRMLSLTLEELGIIEYDRGRYEKADELFKRALNYAKQSEAVGRTHVGWILLWLANTKLKRGDWNISEEYFSKAMNFVSKDSHSTEDSVDFKVLECTVHADLVNYSYYKGEKEKARFHLEKSVNLAKRFDSSSDRAAANIFFKAGLFFEKIEEVSKSVSYLKRSLALSTKVLRPGHMGSAITRTILARNFRKLGRFDRAVEQGRLSQIALADLFEPQHTEVGRSTIHLAVCLAAGEKWREVLDLLATPEGEALFHFEDYKPGWALFCLVKSYLALEDLPAAEQSLKRVKLDDSCREESRAMVLLSRAEVARAQGELDGISELEDEAREAWPKAPIPPHFRAHLTKLFD